MTAVLDRPVPAPDQPAPGGAMTIWEHLAELRRRLIRCALALLVAGTVGFLLYPYLLELLRRPLDSLVTDHGFIALDPLEPFATRLKISAYSAFVLAMPVLLWQVWRFVTPGLHRHERRYAITFVVTSMALFVLGATIAYVTLNPALEFLISMGGGIVEPRFTVDNYVTLIAYMMLAFGVGLQFPLLLVALQLVGALTPQRLLSWWRQVLVVIAIVAAVITPSADPISMAALAVPMTVLYFVAIAIGVVVVRRRPGQPASR